MGRAEGLKLSLGKKWEGEGGKVKTKALEQVRSCRKSRTEI